MGLCVIGAAPLLTSSPSKVPIFAAGSTCALGTCSNAQAGIDRCNASAGSCTTACPPCFTISVNPAAPSSRAPDSTTPIAPAAKANAAERNSGSINGRCPFSVGPTNSSR